MTGMPASLAFWRAGRIALLSCASRIRTLAPCEISVSTSVSCCSELRFASALMYLPPASSMVFFRFGSSWAAQRGCWKLFHDTPTVQPAPDAVDAAGALVLRRCRRVPLEHAAATHHERREQRRQSSIHHCDSSSKCVAIPSRNERRCPARLPPSLSRETVRTHVASRPFGLLPADRVAGPSVMHWRAPMDSGGARASQPDRRSTARMRAPPHRAAAHRPRASRGRRGPVRAGPRARAGRARARARPDERMDPAEQATEHDQLRVEDVDQAGQPDARASDRHGRGRSARPASRPRPRAASRRPRRDRRPSAGRPCAAAPPRRSRSPSSRPSRSGTATPFGLTGRWPTSPAVARGPGQRLAVDDQPAADAVLAGDEQHVAGSRSRRRAAARPGRRGPRRWRPRSGPTTRARRRARRPAARRASRGWAPSTRTRRSAGRRRRPPPRRRPAARRAGRRERRSAASSARSAAIASTEVWPLGRSIADRARRPRRRARRWPRRSSRPRSRAPSTTAPCGSRQTTGEGRPGTPAGSARSSATRSAADSSPIRPRIALRVRPVRATSSEREAGPPAWSSRTIALRLARRTVSLRCPTASRRIVTGLCSFLPNVVTHWSTTPVRVKHPDRETERTMTSLRWGVLSTADIARKKVIPGLLQGRALRGRGDRFARRGPGAHRRRRARHPDRPRLVRGAPRRSRRGCRLHPAAEPPPCRVDDRRGPCRQARPVREAAGHDRRRRGADGRGLRGRRRPADGGVHVSPPPVVGRRHGGRRRPAGSAGCARSRAGSRTTTTTRRTSGTQLEAGGGALFDIGCYSVNLSRMLFDAEPGAVEASVIRDPVERRRHADQRDPRVRRRCRHVHLLDPGRDRPARPRLRQRGPAVDRDPVQHPARSADARVRDRGRRPAGGAGDRDPDVPDRRPVHRRGRALRGRHPRRHADADAARGRGRQPARHRADLRGREPRGARDDATRPGPLADVALPDFGMPDAEPAIPAAVYATRLDRLREAMDRRGYDRLVVYADREHSANLAWLTGFDPRFEEAIAVVGPTEQPADPRRQRVLRHGGRRAAADAPRPVPGPQPARPATRPVPAAGRDPRRRGHRCRATGRGRRLEGVRGPDLDGDAGLPRRRAAPADRSGAAWSRTRRTC